MTRGFTSRVRPLHRRHLVPAVLMLAAALATGCAEEGSAELVSADAPVLIEPSQSYVTFQNRAGLPLVEVTVSILPYGPAEYTRILTRIENTGKRQIPLNEFRSRDGTVFNLRVSRPKAVRVRAKDLNGKNYELEVPWK